MKQESKHLQGGASVLGIVIVLAFVGMIFVIAARVIPSYIEFKGVQSAVEKARSGPTPDRIRATFDAAAQVDNITSIKGADLDITKNDAGEVVVRYAYEREFSLVGPASLKIRYEGQAP